LAYSRRSRPQALANVSIWRRLEILKVFEIAAKHKASVHVHIRLNDIEPDGTFPGFQEVLADAAATGAALRVVHIHSTGGANVLHELDMIPDGSAASACSPPKHC
jgi:phosphoribosylformimino-5-aminoimidazole carboxamide ribonucleotide (ProFAR) isomerase